MLPQYQCACDSLNVVVVGMSPTLGANSRYFLLVSKILFRNPSLTIESILVYFPDDTKERKSKLSKASQEIQK